MDLQRPVLKMEVIHEGRDAKDALTETGSLHRVLPLSICRRGMFVENMSHQWVERGMVNAVMGMLHDIIVWQPSTDHFNKARRVVRRTRVDRMSCKVARD